MGQGGWSRGSAGMIPYQLSTSTQNPSPAIWLCSLVSVFSISCQPDGPYMGFSLPREPDSPTPNSGLSKFLSSDWPLTGCSYLFTLLGTLGLCPRLCLKRPPDFPLSVLHFFFMSRDIWGLQVAPGATVSQSLLIST